MRSTRIGTVVSLIFLFLLFAAACSRPPRGEFPYDAGVLDLQEAPASLASLRGHPAVVVTYSASMPDCGRRIRRFVTLSDGFRGTDVRFVAVDIDPMGPGMFPESFPADHGNVLFLKDRNKAVTRALKIDITPTTFLVSADGIIRDRIAAEHSWDSPDFRQRVESLARSR